MQLAVIFEPTLSNVIAVVHVRNHDIPDARIGLRLCKAHRLSDSAHDQHHAGGAGDEKKFALVAVHRFSFAAAGLSTSRHSFTRLWHAAETVAPELTETTSDVVFGLFFAGICEDFHGRAEFN